jgi:hypothetical protein
MAVIVFLSPLGRKYYYALNKAVSATRITGCGRSFVAHLQLFRNHYQPLKWWGLIIME